MSGREVRAILEFTMPEMVKLPCRALFARLCASRRSEAIVHFQMVALMQWTLCQSPSARTHIKLGHPGALAQVALVLGEREHTLFSECVCVCQSACESGKPRALWVLVQVALVWAGRENIRFSSHINHHRGERNNMFPLTSTIISERNNVLPLTLFNVD